MKDPPPTHAHPAEKNWRESLPLTMDDGHKIILCLCHALCCRRNTMVMLLGPHIFQLVLSPAAAFIIAAQCQRCHRCSLQSNQNRVQEPRSTNFDRSRTQIRGGVDIDEGDCQSSYESSGSFTKGIVSSLTSVTNAILGTFQDNKSSRSAAEEIATLSSAPTSPEELLARIRKEYIENNYLWTGNLDVSCFTSNCTFTDPTLSFVGVDNYVKNVGNLVPAVNFLLGDKNSSRSELLNIALNDDEKYIETRWNMVGELDTLFWKPKIDVIGRTKFWYRSCTMTEGSEAEDKAYQVYFYDEKWEIPAGLALMQLVTKAGTIPNTRETI